MKWQLALVRVMLKSQKEGREKKGRKEQEDRREGKRKEWQRLRQRGEGRERLEEKTLPETEGG